MTYDQQPQDQQPSDMPARPDSAEPIGGSPSGQPTGQTGDQPAVKTKLARQWLIRMIPITLALIAFGGWALADLVHFYPKRGRDYAAYMQLEYLRASNDARTLFEASIPEPRDRMIALREKRSAASLTELETAQLVWLEALAVPGLGMLDPQHTVMASPREELNRLEERFARDQQPKGLSSFDLPSQWLIMFICWGFAVYLIFFWMRVASKTYQWDPATKRLTLDSGQTLVPADLQDMDKSKWHKFIITLEIKESHPTLGGQKLDIDLFRYQHLESWILEMEQEAFPDRQQDDDEQAELDTSETTEPDKLSMEASDDERREESSADRG